ncbi:TBC1 domain family member 1-like isoform X2 [Sycon ciliatum]|uniref:TBC1 domain family member 1-like isoform X2 n=1 Tax=Sycon ciliatum TaxID=27933 RepID=UPI0031F696A4
MPGVFSWYGDNDSNAVSGCEGHTVVDAKTGIATVHDAWSGSSDRVKTNPKSMDLLSLIPPEKQGLLTLSTALQVEEHRFNVRYLGQMTTTASTGSSALVDKIVEAAMNKQKEQQRRRQQIIKEGRLQQSRREMQLQRKESQEQPASGGQDNVDGVLSDIVASTTHKVKAELQGAAATVAATATAAINVQKEPSDSDLKDIHRSQSQGGTAKSRFFNLIRRGGQGPAGTGIGSSTTLTPTSSDSPTHATSSDEKLDFQRSVSGPNSSSPPSNGAVPELAMTRRSSDGRLSSSPRTISASPMHMDDIDSLQRDRSKCSSRASNVTESTLTASSTGPVTIADSGDSGVSAASTPDSDRHIFRTPSSSVLSDSSGAVGCVFSDRSDSPPSYGLNYRIVNLCISAESIRFYDTSNAAGKARRSVSRSSSSSAGEELADSTTTKRLCWERKLSSVSYCAKGHIHSTSWCLIVSESSSASSAPAPGINSSPNFVCYLFSCETEESCVTIMESITKSFKVAFELHRNPPVTIRSPFCETCPMYTLHKLCVQVNNCLNAKAAQAFATKAIEGLPKEDRTWMSDRAQAIQQFSEDVQLQITMGMLRGISERLQSEHSHSDSEKPMEVEDNDEATSKPRLGPLSRAKRTLASSIEGLRKKDRPAASPSAIRAGKSESPSTSLRRKTIGHEGDAESGPESARASQRHPSLPVVSGQVRSSPLHGSPHPSPPGTPTLSVPAHTPPSLRRRTPRSPTRKTSFRHSIYKTAHATPGGQPLSPSKEAAGDDEDDDELTKKSGLDPLLTPRRDYTSSPTARGLWKRAIDEQVMLVRLEKASQKHYEPGELEARRLAYGDMLEQSEQERLTQVWEKLLSSAKNAKLEQLSALKSGVRKAVADGIPKGLHGRAWKLLNSLQPPSKLLKPKPVGNSDSGYSTPPANGQILDFEILKVQSTPFLHAIIIDLGRTFPGHEYFQSVAGPGQCSLFHVLRAYASVDQDVGYCQGLSFVAGLLIMHADTDSDAFHFLLALMYDELRDQYKPDMARLQVRLYQLSRLLHDYHPRMHDLFEKHDVAPFFYAAPWFLTLFCSQFPLYFATRTMDLIFLDGIDAIFKVCLTLLRHAERQLLECTSFEQILECMKAVLPALGARVPDTIVREAMDMDIHEKLRTFEVEHAVLQDLDNTQTMSADLEAANIALRSQHTDLIQQLAVARGSALRLQDTVNELSTENARLVQQSERFTVQITDLRHTVAQLQRQLAVNTSTESREEAAADEVNEGVSTGSIVIRRNNLKPPHASGLRRRLSVPVFSQTRPMVQRRYQRSFDDLAETPISKLEQFFAEADLDNMRR